jgi:hypothetical protein
LSAESRLSASSPKANETYLFVYTCRDCNAKTHDPLAHSLEKNHLKGYSYVRVPLVEDGLASIAGIAPLQKKEDR